VAILLGTDERGWLRRYPQLFVPAMIVLAAGVWIGAQLALKNNAKIVAVRRNFYGVLSVRKKEDEGDIVLILLNGRITHGIQFVDDERHTVPTTYYGRVSGIGRAIDFFASQSVPSLRVGAIGLGTGTLAAYARPNDQFVFYEINPEVPKISRQYFTYLKDAEQRMAQGRGSLDISMGDARLSLERELTERTEGRRFHVIAVDAFSGDAIPTHLLTRQAGDVYKRHLDPEGVLAIHISNRYLNLAPVVRGLAEHLKMNVIEIDSDGTNDDMVYSANWMLLTNNEKLLSSLASFAKKEDSQPPALLWTDDYSDLVRILK
jgi:spermidine synthase